MNDVKFGKRLVVTTDPPTPWWSSMSSLLYVALNFALIYAFLIWPIQNGGTLALKSIIIWVVLTVFAALLFLWIRRFKLKKDEAK